MFKANKKYLSAFFLVVILTLAFSSYSHERESKTSKNTEIISRGTAVNLEYKINIYVEATKNKIEKGDSLTILPMTKKFDAFDVKVKEVERVHVCSIEGNKEYKTEFELKNERGWGVYGKLEDQFDFLVLKPKAKNATLLDSVGRELPDGFKESTVEAAVDTDSDGRADLLKFGFCCSRRTHPDSASCRSCTEAYRIGEDRFTLTYSSGGC